MLILVYLMYAVSIVALIGLGIPMVLFLWTRSISAGWHSGKVQLTQFESKFNEQAIARKKASRNN